MGSEAQEITKEEITRHFYSDLKGMSDREQYEALQMFQRKLYENDLFAYLHDMCGFKDIRRHTHGEMIAALEDPIARRKLLIVPRDCFKSSIGQIGYSTWSVIRDPNIRILLDGELFGNSVTYLSSIKNMLESESFVELWGQFRHKNRLWQSDKITIAQRTKTNLKEPTIICGGVGTIKTGLHVDKIISDDLNSQKNSDTPEKAQKVIDHYRYNQSILDSIVGEYVVIGTRYSEIDVPGFILRDILELPNLSEGDYSNEELEGLIVA